MAETKRLEYIDAARGIAVLMVILAHTAQRVPHLTPLIVLIAEFGQMGVQLFFVVSAYTLCLSFERHGNTSREIVFFYIRRFFRIAPLYYTGIFLYFFLDKEFMHTPDLGPYTLANVVANIFFIHGFDPNANNNIVPGGWSIGTEVAFYVLFPIAFLAFKKIAEKNSNLMLLAIGISLIVNLCLQSILPKFLGHGIRNGNFLYYNIINQMPVFISGMALYFFEKSGENNDVYWNRGNVSYRFCFFFCASFFLFGLNANILFTVIPTISGISYLFLLKYLESSGRQSTLLRKIGVASYSMYVFHFVSAWYILPSIIPTLTRFMSGDLVLLCSFFLVTLTTFLIAQTTQKLIEAKGIEAGARLISYLVSR